MLFKSRFKSEIRRYAFFRSLEFTYWKYNLPADSLNSIKTRLDKYYWMVYYFYRAVTTYIFSFFLNIFYSSVYYRISSFQPFLKKYIYFSFCLSISISFDHDDNDDTDNDDETDDADTDNDNNGDGGSGNSGGGGSDDNRNDDDNNEDDLWYDDEDDDSDDDGGYTKYINGMS